MNGKYQIFYPGKYLDWEKDIVAERQGMAKGTIPMGPGPFGPGPRGPDVVKKDDLLKFNRTWDKYNPLFNDVEYAKKAKYPDVPAFPCFKGPRAGGGMALEIPKNTGDSWYYANDGGDMEFFAPIFAGDTFTSEAEKTLFEDITVPGSDLRAFKAGGSAKMFNQKGELVVRSTMTLRQSYRKIIDGSPKPSFTENMSEWVKYFPPAHYTTDEEWAYIKELWDKEHIRGKKTLYWEDVKVGDEPPWTCSGPITYMDLIFWHGGSDEINREKIQHQSPDITFKDQYGQFFGEGAIHYGTRNIPGARAVFYNHTAALHITRMVTNYIGDAGFVTRITWFFKQLFKEMQVERPGGKFLDKVPYMKGKACTVHGSEGDTIIAKGYVTDKYINDKGEHIIDLTCWGETLDKRIIEVVGASVKLPSKGK